MPTSIPFELLLEVGVALTLLVDLLSILGPLGFGNPLVAVPDIAMHGTERLCCTNQQSQDWSEIRRRYRMDISRRTLDFRCCLETPVDTSY